MTNIQVGDLVRFRTPHQGLKKKLKTKANGTGVWLVVDETHNLFTLKRGSRTDRSISLYLQKV